MLLAPWLEEPKVEIFEGEGPPSALISLRDLRPCGTVQPTPSCLVFFHLAPDHWPVSIEFLEPVPARFAFQILTRLIESTQGDYAGVDLAPAQRFIPLSPAEMATLLRAMAHAQERLEAASLSQSASSSE